MRQRGGLAMGVEMAWAFGEISLHLFDKIFLKIYLRVDEPTPYHTHSHELGILHLSKSVY